MNRNRTTEQEKKIINPPRNRANLVILQAIRLGSQIRIIGKKDILVYIAFTKTNSFQINVKTRISNASF